MKNIVVQSNKPEEEMSEEEQEIKSIKALDNLLPPPIPKAISPRDSVKKLTTKFKRLVEKYKIFKILDDEAKRVSLLVELYQELTLSFNDENQPLSLKQVTQLNEIQTNLTKEAKEKLLLALMQKNFEHAKKLHNFFSLIDFNILNVALKTENIELLEFLINEAQLPIETYPVQITGKKYTNALHYCYMNANSSNKLDKVMALLIRCGGNLLQPVEPAGLPMAHYILTARPEHPLMEVIQAEGEHILKNKFLYQQLERTCRRRIKQENISPAEKDNLKFGLYIYKEHLESLNFVNNFFTPKSQRAKEQASELLKRTELDKQLVEKLYSDPTILRLKQALQKQCKEMIDVANNYSKFERTKITTYNFFTQKNLNMVEEQLMNKWLDLNPEKGPEASKKYFIEFIEKFLALQHDIICYITIEQRISRLTKTTHNIHSPAIKEDKKMLNELLLRIQENAKILPEKEIKQILSTCPSLRFKKESSLFAKKPKEEASNTGWRIE